MKEFSSTTIAIICTACVFIGLGMISLGIGLGLNQNSYIYKISSERLELSYQGSKDTLVSAIDNYIKRVAPTSCMNGLAFINAADKYNVDVVFMLAQCQVEGHFCTKGLSAKMNSGFNVGAYDGKGSKYMKKYKHPDQSIEPYLKLLISHYLVDGKTEMNLMDEYIDINGQRYASAKDYETKLLDKYKYIINNTNIGKLVNNYNKYKILTNR